MIKWIVFSVFFSFSTIAFSWGGDEKGNGGNVLVCQNNQDVTYELLDFYEARVIYNYKTDLNYENEPWQNLVQKKIQQISIVSPLRAADYTKLLAEILENKIFLKDGEFVSSEDAGPVLIPDNCKIKQIASQFVHPVSKKRFFYFNLDVWNQLDSFQKAGLLLHEIILVEAIESGHQTSKRARHLNALVNSQDFHQLSQKDFRDFIQSEIGFRYSDYENFWVEIFDENGSPRINKWYPNGNPKYVFTKPNSKICWGLACWLASRSQDIQPDLSFYESGHLKAGYAIQGQINIEGQIVEFKDLYYFHDDKSISRINITSDSPFIFDRWGQKIQVVGRATFYLSGTLKDFSYLGLLKMSIAQDQQQSFIGISQYKHTVTLYPNLNIQSAYVEKGVELKTRTGKTKVKSTALRHFDELGYLINP